MSKIVAVRKDFNDEIMLVKLNNGKVLSRSEAYNLAIQGKIEHVKGGISVTGKQYIRSTPDDTEGNNLSNLPTF